MKHPDQERRLFSPMLSHHALTGLLILLVYGLSVMDALATGYSMCQGPMDSKPYMVCGSGCPMGESFVSYSPNTPEQCAAHLQDGCLSVSNLHYELGWDSGHKTNFCKKRGFDGVTNHPGSKYKDHGGGWCYKGDNNACTASLPSQP